MTQQTKKERQAKRGQMSEMWIKVLFAIAAGFSILAVIAIVLFLFMEAFPALQTVGILDFLFGTSWNGNSSDLFYSDYSGSYGILTMIVGTVYSTIGALLIGGVLGYFTAIYISKFCPAKLKSALKQIVSLLAGIPSVVYGFFGIQVIGSSSILGLFSSNGSGTGLLLVSIILGIMIVPTIVSLSVSALDAVPENYYEGARALGCSHEQAVFGAVVPAAKSGITASFILGIGRALGETMAVALLAGGNEVFPTSLFGSFQTLTAKIAAEMAEGGELQTGVLFAIGCVLLIFTLIVIISFRLITNAGDKKSKDSTDSGEVTYPGKASYFLKGRYEWLDKVKKWVAPACAVITVGMLAWVIIHVMVSGLPYLTLDLFSTEFSFSSSTVTLLPSIILTFMLIGITILIGGPIGIAAAIYLVEYTKKGNKFTQVIRTAIEVLAGIPSIVYGLFGFIFFVQMLNGGSYAVWCGGATMALMIIPIIERSTEEALYAVSDGYREGSFALGAGKARTIFKVVLPSAFAGILASIILSMGRTVSESAPVMFTMGTSPSGMPTGLNSSGASLSVMMYYLAKEGKHLNEAWATACVLIFIVLGLNIISTVAGNAIRKRMTRV